jgi:hypothetical protein
VRTGAVEPERDHVTFFDECVQLDVRVREPLTHIAQHDPDESVRAMDVTQRAVRDEVLVDEARERFGLPVTTGFQPPDWQYFPDLATAVGDFSFLNVHPWWVLHRNDPLTAANWVAEAYQVVAGTPGIPADRVVVVQETSFPSGAVAPEATPGATPENQKRFYDALLATGVPFVWFLAIDSPMHRTASPVGGFAGLWDENWQAKPVVELLAAAL